MRKVVRTRLALIGVAALATTGSIGAAGMAASAAVSNEPASVIADAGAVGTEIDDSAEPNAAPVAVAFALARGFTAASAPRAVAQAARAGSFLQGLGFLAAAQTNAEAGAIQNAYFDR